ncbi:MAG TPA: hypothetical protein VLX92_03835 [Kofleriaceae bacterium]|nr:hypothetical protein [Kofleriaceae bacterium]
MKLPALALVLAVTGCLAGPGDDPAPPGAQPGAADEAAAPSQVLADDPAEFVLTPAGYYHEDCVFDVGDGATIDEDGTSVTYADGTTDTLPACTHAHYASLEDLRAGIPAGVAEPTYTGWVSDEGKWAPSWWHKLTATWSVPTSPSHYTGQTIFLWPGFEPNGVAAVVQPVLQYGPSTAGGGQYWTIASWYCASSCPHGTLRRVSVGDVIEGTVSGSSCTSKGVCTWAITTKDKHSGATSTLSRRDSHPMALAITTLEVWNLKSCNELPSSGGESFDITVDNASGSVSTSGWGKWKASNMSPSCNYSESSSDHAHTFLFWN